MKWFKRFGEHGNLLSAMINRTGASFGNTDGLAAENVVRQAINCCLACRSEDECRAWLEIAEPGARPPEFCRNGALLDSLRTPKKAVWP
jgi:hypothetical protein